MSNDARGTASRRPVLLLGIDGLAASFLDAPLVAESTPNLTELLSRSARGPLTSTFPPYTGPAWTTITTGVDPGRHGIFGFTDEAGRPVSDAGVSAPRLWDYVGAAGGRSVVVNVPITYPARPIAGELVAGMPVPPRAPFTAPADLAGELEERNYVVDVAVQEGARETTTTLARLARMTEARARVVSWLAATRTWDLFAVVFVLPDRLGHPWWKQLVPGDRIYEGRAAQRVRDATRPALAALDRAVGDLLGSLPHGAAVVLCSDHGFGPLRADIFFDLVLARAGLIEARASRARRVATRLARTSLARRAPAALHRWARTRASGGDRARRRAWTAPSYESGVRLADPADADLAARVSDLLRGLRTPDGAPVARAVFRRDDLYRGPRRGEAADLLCVVEDESIALHDGLHAPGPWVSRGRVAWGTHATEGVVAISGADAPRRVRGQAADIAPTVLSLMGLRVEGLDGTPLVGSAGEVAVEAAAPRPGAASGAYSPEQEAAVLEHLQGLGYVD
jgi:predicted AlkP superfamily phosphohydrolase/phosphomutase